jgi:glycosyltransferase involved in cell wall biosynthesis
VRVLHVLACDELAGTELMVASLIVRSDPSRVRHELAVLAGPGPIVERVRAASRRAVTLGGWGGLPGAALRLGRLLRARDYDVVSAYGFKASVAARVLVRLLGVRAAFVCGVRGRHVTDAQDLGSSKARFGSAVERLLSPLVDVYDANSRGALELLASLGVDRGRLVHIPNGLDLSVWIPSDRERDEPPTIVCAARFVALKRHVDLLRALALVERGGHAFRAVLPGDGPTLPEVQALVDRAGLDSVELPGRVGPEAMRDILAGASIACLPSMWEGMPGALMEAMASGVAVVGTDVDGTNELVTDGDTGLLVPLCDPPALAAAIASLLEDPGQRRRLALAARRRMEERYSLDVMLRAKEGLYLDLAERFARSRAATPKPPPASSTPPITPARGAVDE